MPATTGKRSYWTLAQLLPLAAVGAYAVVILALFTPYFQNHFVFLHSVNYPFYANFSNPERYGIAPSKARNLRITTGDGLSIGAWHLVPDCYYHKVHPKVTSDPLYESDFNTALQKYPTVIYFHGNAGNRAAPFRTASYAFVTSRMHANVVAIDYRGFGDSKAPGVSPSEEGLIRDARAAWDWVVARSGRQADDEPGKHIALMAQSLGTGVASQLALQVASEGQSPQALILIAPYASLRSLVFDYRLGGTIPVMGPLRNMPGIETVLDNFLITQFNSTQALHQLYHGMPRDDRKKHVPHLVLVHATSDDVIPFQHSEHIFSTLRDTELARVADARVQSQQIDGFGKISHLDLQGLHTPGIRASGKDGGEWNGHGERSASLNLLRTLWGGHNTGFSEGVADFARQLLGWGLDGLGAA
ncbi:hypothetical protein V8E36_000935 [Tilletia maclaganii]